MLLRLSEPGASLLPVTKNDEHLLLGMSCRFTSSPLTKQTPIRMGTGDPVESVDWTEHGFGCVMMCCHKGANKRMLIGRQSGP